MALETLYGIVALGSVIASILAWVAKLRWSKEFAQAKDETIRAKEAQIEALKSQIDELRHMTPMKLREYFDAVQATLEAYVDKLKKQLENARLEIAEKDRAIENMRDAGAAQITKRMQLQEEKAIIERKVAEMQKRLADLDIQFLPKDFVRLGELINRYLSGVALEPTAGSSNTPLPLRAEKSADEN
jgi:chromosome segregation ATPase